MQLSAVVVVIVASSLATVASAADLDTPLNDKPTIKSEIVRGWRASFDCGLSHAIDILAMEECVFKQGDKAQQEHVDSDPFLVGLYVGTTLHFATSAAVDARDQNSNAVAAADLPIDKSEELKFYSIFRQYRDHLKVTGEQVLGALPDLSESGRQSAIIALRELKVSSP